MLCFAAHHNGYLAYYTCADIGANNITLTATDIFQNVTTCTGVVTVQDNNQPPLNCTNSKNKRAESENLSLLKATENLDITITPNPFRDELLIHLNEIVERTLDLRLIDLSGRVVISRTIEPSGHYSKVQVRTDEKLIKSGVYILSINSVDAHYHQLVVKN